MLQQKSSFGEVCRCFRADPEDYNVGVDIYDKGIIRYHGATSDLKANEEVRKKYLVV